jgi:hypothetical protein
MENSNTFYNSLISQIENIQIQQRKINLLFTFIVISELLET